MRTLIDIDDEVMRLAAEELGTTTAVATVNAALRRIAEQRGSRLMTADLLQMDLDLDDDTMRGRGGIDRLRRGQVCVGVATPRHRGQDGDGRADRGRAVRRLPTSK